MKKTAPRDDDPRTRTLRRLSQARLQLSRTQAVLVDLNQQVRDATERLAARDQSKHMREANEQLVISALNAHAATELSERSRRDGATSFERRVRREARAKEALAKLNVNLEDRVSERTRQLEIARDEALAAVHAKEQFLSNTNVASLCPTPAREIRCQYAGGCLALTSEPPAHHAARVNCSQMFIPWK